MESLSGNRNITKYYVYKSTTACWDTTLKDMAEKVLRAIYLRY